MAGRLVENEAFVTLMRVAREDPEIGRMLNTILGLDRFNRKSLLNTWVEELTMKSAPRDFIEAVGSLVDDDIAARALEVIKGGL